MKPYFRIILSTHDIFWSGWGTCPLPFGCKSWQTDRRGRSAYRIDRESWTLTSVPPLSFLLSLEAPDMLVPCSQVTLKKISTDCSTEYSVLIMYLEACCMSKYLTLCRVLLLLETHFVSQPESNQKKQTPVCRLQVCPSPHSRLPRR